MSALDQVRRQLEAQGYALIVGFLTPDQLELLRTEAEVLYELAQEVRHEGGAPGNGSQWGMAAESRASCIYEGVPGHLCTAEVKSSYAVYKQHRTRRPLGPGVWSIMFQSQLAELVLGLLGPGALLFNDQYIIKPPLSPLSSFAWHRDSDWCRGAEVDYHPYISVWIALDDMDEGNGCFVVQPGSHLQSAASGGAGGCGCGGGEREAQAQQQQQQRRQQQRQQQQRQQLGGKPGCNSRGELGSVPGQQSSRGLPLRVRAGTAIVTSDSVLHGSGPNCSRHMRRAWMPQFSAGRITWRGSGQPVGLAVPLRA